MIEKILKGNNNSRNITKLRNLVKVECKSRHRYDNITGKQSVDPMIVYYICIHKCITSLILTLPMREHLLIHY